MLGGASEELENIQLTQPELLAEMKILITKGASANEAAKSIAQKYGQSKRFLYALLHDVNTKNRN